MSSRTDGNPHMNFGSFSSDDLKNIEPAISLPVKKTKKASSSNNLNYNGDKALSSSTSLNGPSDSHTYLPNHQPSPVVNQPNQLPPSSSQDPNNHHPFSNSNSSSNHTDETEPPHGQLIYPYDPQFAPPYLHPYNHIPAPFMYQYMPPHMPPPPVHMVPMHMAPPPPLQYYPPSHSTLSAASPSFTPSSHLHHHPPPPPHGLAPVHSPYTHNHHPQPPPQPSTGGTAPSQSPPPSSLSSPSPSPSSTPAQPHVAQTPPPSLQSPQDQLLSPAPNNNNNNNNNDALKLPQAQGEPQPPQSQQPPLPHHDQGQLAQPQQEQTHLTQPQPQQSPVQSLQQSHRQQLSQQHEQVPQGQPQKPNKNKKSTKAHPHPHPQSQPHSLSLEPPPQPQSQDQASPKQQPQLQPSSPSESHPSQQSQQQQSHHAEQAQQQSQPRASHPRQSRQSHHQSQSSQSSQSPQSPQSPQLSQSTQPQQSQPSQQPSEESQQASPSYTPKPQSPPQPTPQLTPHQSQEPTQLGNNGPEQAQPVGQLRIEVIHPAAHITPSPQPTEPPKPKTWSSLFASVASAHPPTTTPTKTAPTTPPPSNEAAAKPKQNGAQPHANGKVVHEAPPPSVPVPLTAKMLQELKQTLPSTAPLPPLPRGLVNPTNTCFLNVTLQSLVYCFPFTQLLSKLENVTIPQSQMPVTEKFVRLYNEFIRPSHRPASNAANHHTNTTSHASSATSSSSKHYAQTAHPLLPEFFFDLLQPFSERTGIPYKDGDKVNQQDAQEFLTYILDLMHEEFLSFHKKYDQQNKSAEDEKKNAVWEEVGKKNKSSIVLTTKESYAQSIISNTFGGTQRSAVKKQSQGKPSVTTQPFYCLHLDIDKPHIKSLEDALDAYMEPEKLEGYTCDVRGVEVQASKLTTLAALPRVLILHLKRFAYDSSQATRKLDKFISFPQKLTIKKSFLSNDRVATDAQRVYSLCSVVEHHGKVAVKGHYTCDINVNLFSKLSPTSTPPPSPSSSSSSTTSTPAQEWLNFDDQIVRRVYPKDVQNRLAYLLFYVQH